MLVDGHGPSRVVIIVTDNRLLTTALSRLDSMAWEGRLHYCGLIPVADRYAVRSGQELLSPHAQLLIHEARQLLQRYGGAVIVSLYLGTVIGPQKLDLFVRFRTLGNHQHVQPVGHFDDHGAHRFLVGVVGHLAQEAGVDLEYRYRQFGEVGKL